MQVIECKAVYLWDGGDRQNFGFHIAATVPDVEIQVAHPHCRVDPAVLVIFDSLQQVVEHNRANLARSAWEKLTPLERKALNLSKPN